MPINPAAHNHHAACYSLWAEPAFLMARALARRSAAACLCSGVQFLPPGFFLVAVALAAASLANVLAFLLPGGRPRRFLPSVALPGGRPRFLGSAAASGDPGGATTALFNDPG